MYGGGALYLVLLHVSVCVLIIFMLYSALRGRWSAQEVFPRLVMLVRFFLTRSLTSVVKFPRKMWIVFLVPS